MTMAQVATVRDSRLDVPLFGRAACSVALNATLEARRGSSSNGAPTTETSVSPELEGFLRFRRCRPGRVVCFLRDLLVQGPVH